MRKPTIAIPLSLLAVGGLAGGAYAATQSGSSPQQVQQAFLNDAAHRLQVSPARLSGALRQALIDRINAAASAGRLTPAQAGAIKQRIEQGRGLPLAPLLGGPPHPGFQMVAPSGFGLPLILTSAAGYLGLTDRQLGQRLRSGQTLAQIASAQGRSKTGLERAITATVSSQLEKAVSAGRLPRALESRILKGFAQHIQDLVNGRPVLSRGGPPGPPPDGHRLQITPPAGSALPLPPPVIQGAL